MDRLSSGNPQLDSVLGGGFPRQSIHVVMGLPGSGKTILAQQLAFANAEPRRPVLFLTTASEPLSKVVGFLQEMSFARVDEVGSSVHYESVAEVLRDHPEALVDHLAERIRDLRPSILIVDSFKAIHELVTDPVRWRNLLFDLAGLLSAYDLTTFWVGEYPWEALAHQPEFAVADGILELRRQQAGARDDRYLRVVKLRGSPFRDGDHTFTISRHGLAVSPRLTGPGGGRELRLGVERLQTGIDGLDQLIELGWLRSTSTLVAGPSGAGKTMLGLHFLRHGVDSGEPGLLVCFQENPNQLRRVMTSLGWETEGILAGGRLDVLYTSPVELHVDTVVQEIFHRVELHGVRRVVIDALGDVSKAAGDPARFSDFVYALTQELAARDVTSMLLLEAPGAARDGEVQTGSDISYMSDNILLLSMELGTTLRRTVRILKTRGSAHDGEIHGLTIGAGGMVVD